MSMSDKDKMIAAWHAFEKKYKISNDYYPNEQMIYMAFEAAWKAAKADNTIVEK